MTLPSDWVADTLQSQCLFSLATALVASLLVYVAFRASYRHLSSRLRLCRLRPLSVRSKGEGSSSSSCLHFNGFTEVRWRMRILSNRGKLNMHMCGCSCCWTAFMV